MSSLLRKKAKQFVQSVQGGTDRWVSWLKGTAFKVIAVLLLGTLQLWLSLFLYGSFYYAYMPTVAHISPVYLQFSSCVEFGAQNNCPFPSVNTSLLKNPDMGSLLMRGQKYRVMLELDMPQSPVNEKLGVFMVRLDLYAAGGQIIGSSARPAMMHYQSNLLKTIQTLFFIPFLLTGYSEEKQSISVSLMENFVDNPYKPVIGANIQLQARQFEVYSSVLKIHAHFTGLRYLMYQWPMSTALVFVGIFFLFLSLITVVSWQQCTGIFSSGQQDPTVVRMEDVYSVSYEERRKMIRKSMALEREALFKGRPKNVTVLQGDQEDSQSSGISSVGEAFTGERGSSVMDTIRSSSGVEEDAGGTTGRAGPETATNRREETGSIPAAVDGAGSQADEEKVVEAEEADAYPVVEPAEAAAAETDIDEEDVEKEGEDSEGRVEVLESAVDGPLVMDGEELRQRKKDPDNNYL